MRWCRRLAVACWLGAAAAWLAQAFVPWTARGPLSRSSLLDAASLIQDRILVSVPSWTVWLALLLPVTGAAIAVLALVPGVVAATLRPVSALVGTAAVLALLDALTHFRTDRFGVGSWLGIIGVVAVVAAVSLEWKTRSRHEVLP
ncbi:hypothetical protein ACLM5J_08375 [Nocardioides sp. Bht2]|uniref:hypothetical protein n=1 Tax=Nocardioides sp. Bht2 TaxID=3392297 RepID=UPI0039B45836